MTAEANRRELVRRLRRLGVWTIGLAPVVCISIITVLWVDSRLPRWVYWKIGLIFLIVMEIAYGIAAVLAVLGIPVQGFFLFSRWRSRSGRVAAARGLSLCVCLLLGLLAAEAVTAVWMARARRATAMPVGGFAEENRPAWLADRPISLTREDFPTEFPNSKVKAGINLLILGESSAEGVPYNFWVSIGGIVSWQLTEAIPDRPNRVQALAVSGSNLEKQQELLRGLKRRPDVLIVYCGHNEFSTRLDSSRDLDHYFDERLPAPWTILVEWVEGLSPVCGLIRQTAAKCRIAIPPSRYGNRKLIDVPAYTSTEYNTILADFRRRLEAIVSYAERIGAIPILIAPPANDAGFEPNRSYLPARTPRSEREAFRRDFEAARRLEDGDPKASTKQFRELLARQPDFAETHYRLARLLERAGGWDEAYRHYVAARDLDGYPMRCVTAFQDVYRDVAARHGCILIDGQACFHAIGRHGLLDDYLFHDGIHPSLRGQIALAQAILQSLRERRAFGWPKDLPAVLIDPGRCNERFRLDAGAWNYICRWGIMFYDLAAFLRYDPSQRLAKREAFRTGARRISEGVAPEDVGLPNIGIPEPVPSIPAALGSGREPSPARARG